MKKLLPLMSALLLTACGSPSNQSSAEEENTLTSRFNSTLNIYESVEQNPDNGIITYKAVSWGGLVGSVKERNLPVDWSAYEAITVVFAGTSNAASVLSAVMSCVNLIFPPKFSSYSAKTASSPGRTICSKET